MTTSPSDRLANVLKAVGHPVRLEIVRQLARNNTRCCGDVCACFPLSQSTISQHISVLKDAGIVCMERDGTRSRYQLDRKVLDEVFAEFEVILDALDGEANER